MDSTAAGNWLTGRNWASGQRLGAILSLLAAFSLLSEADAAVFRRSDNGQIVANAAVETTLSRSGLLLHLATGESRTVYGLKISATEKTLLYVSVSTEFVIAAVLSGAATTPKIPKTALPGQMFVLGVSKGSAVAIEYFDAKQFLAAPPRGLPADAIAQLQQVSTHQASRIWWGALQRTILNVQSPVPPLVEGVRRDYLLEPPVVRLRQTAGADPTVYATQAAQKFVDAMSRRDVHTVRALLHPTMFVSQQAGPNWLAKRHIFATQLARGPLAANMRGARVSLDGDGRIIAARKGKRWEIVMSVLDAGVFVAAVEPR